jgi:hypothetical protein
MNKLKKLIILISAAITLAGCVSTTQEIVRRTKSTRSDVFVEVPAKSSIPPEFVDLIIKASIKIPLDRHYALGSTRPVQEKPGYPFLVNIDGQAVLWRVGGQKESVSLYDKGYTSRDPDAGEGVKYNLEKKIRLSPGLHKVFFGLPNEDFLSEFKVLLNNSESQVIEFKPLYHYKTYPVRIPTFLKGLDRYEAVLNGQVVRPVVSDYGSYGFKSFLPDP